MKPATTRAGSPGSCPRTSTPTRRLARRCSARPSRTATCPTACSPSPVRWSPRCAAALHGPGPAPADRGAAPIDHGTGRLIMGLAADPSACRAAHLMINFEVAAGGQGRDRTADLPLFRRTLVPTELPGPSARGAGGPDGTCTRDLRLDRAASTPTAPQDPTRLNDRLCPQRDSNPCYRLERAAS